MIVSGELKFLVVSVSRFSNILVRLDKWKIFVKEMLTFKKTCRPPPNADHCHGRRTSPMGFKVGYRWTEQASIENMIWLEDLFSAKHFFEDWNKIRNMNATSKEYLQDADNGPKRPDFWNQRQNAFVPTTNGLEHFLILLPSPGTWKGETLGSHHGQPSYISPTYIRYNGMGARVVPNTSAGENNSFFVIERRQEEGSNMESARDKSIVVTRKALDVQVKLNMKNLTVLLGSTSQISPSTTHSSISCKFSPVKVTVLILTRHLQTNKTYANDETRAKKVISRKTFANRTESWKEARKRKWQWNMRKKNGNGNNYCYWVVILPVPMLTDWELCSDVARIVEYIIALKKMVA